MKNKQLKSFYPKQNDLKESWVLYDATNKVLGTAATDIASMVLGKNKATYTPGVFNQQYVVVVNASKIIVTGKKKDQKKYCFVWYPIKSSQPIPYRFMKRL